MGGGEGGVGGVLVGGGQEGLAQEGSKCRNVYTSKLSRRWMVVEHRCKTAQLLHRQGQQARKLSKRVDAAESVRLEDCRVQRGKRVVG